MHNWYQGAAAAAATALSVAECQGKAQGCADAVLLIVADGRVFAGAGPVCPHRVSDQLLEGAAGVFAGARQLQGFHSHDPAVILDPAAHSWSAGDGVGSLGCASATHLQDRAPRQNEGGNSQGTSLHELARRAVGNSFARTWRALPAETAIG